jgi:hypothetical protein
VLRRIVPLTAVVLLVLQTGTAATPSAPGARAAQVAPGEAVMGPPAALSGPFGRQAIEGPWTFRLDPTDAGVSKGFPTGAFEGRAVTLPHVPNAKPLTGRKGQIGFRGSIAWYRTTFRVPTDGEYAIRFESVHHHASVWLDGKKVAGHTGVYLPFEVRRKLRAGTPHTLVVRANYKGPTRQKRSGWHRTWFNFGGINREVSIRPIGPSDISAPEVRTRLSEADGHAVLDLDVHVTNRTGQRRSIGVTGQLVREGEAIPVGFPAVEVGPGQTRVVETAVRVDRPALWKPGQPNLYDLELEVPGEALFRQRIGLRELKWRGSRMFLNGQQLKLHGASIHEDVKDRGDGLRPQDMDGLVAGLQAIGANSTRSQHQLHPALLERLDAAGIVLWMGLGPIDAPGSWTSKTPEQAETAFKRVQRTYFQTQAHPSVLVWNLANEVAGGNGHPDGQGKFIDRASRWLHRRDPGRMTAVDVWGARPPRTREALGQLYSDLDAIAVTNYAGWYEEPLSGPKRAASLIRARTAGFERAFVGKVLVISEFGAEGNTLNPSGRPGSFSFQRRLLLQHIRHYKSRPALSGMLIWNLRDFAVSPSFFGGSIRGLVPGIKIVRGVNQKGLFDFENRPKPAVGAVRAAFEPLGTGLR